MIYFTDRSLNIIGQASYDLPEGSIIDDDLKTEDVDTGTTTFECKIPFTPATRTQVEACTACGNYILRDGENDGEFYTIIEAETDTKKGEVYIYAEDAGLDLLNEIVGAYAATEAHPIAWYIQYFAPDTGFEVGFNEAADLSRTLSWDGEATITERLASVATQFDCELSYSFAVDGLQLTHKYINIYRERGNDAGVSLRLNYEINNIITSSSIANLATALHPTGGTPEGAETPITLVGYDYADDGDIYLENGYLKSREAVKKWSRYLNPTEPDQNYTGHILRPYTYDTTDQSVLCAHAVTELKKVREMEINYEVDINDLPADVRIGDRINIIDDAGGLYVSSRVLKLETSIANHKRTATLGEYLIKDSGINQKVIDLASAFASKAQETARALAAAQAAQDAADSAASEAAAAAATAQGTQTTVDNMTLTVTPGTGDDGGKLLVNLDGGGGSKTGVIDLTDGVTTISGDNIKTGTITAINIDGVNIKGSTIITDDDANWSRLAFTDGLFVFYDKQSQLSNPVEVGRMRYALYINNNTGLATRTLYLTPSQTDVDILIGDPQNGPNININQSGNDVDGNGVVSPGIRIKGAVAINGKSLVDTIYPIGSIYMSVSSTSPATLFGGTWAQLQNRFLLGAGTSYSNGATGGEATHVLTTSEMPSHSHTITSVTPSGGTIRSVLYTATNTSATGQAYQAFDGGSTGSNSAHNNMPPYLAVYMWKRTA